MSDESRKHSQLITPGPLGKNDPDKQKNDQPLRDDLEDYSGNIYYYWYQFYALGAAKPDRMPIADAQYRKLVDKVSKDFDFKGGEGFRSWWERKGRWLFSQKYETDSLPQKIEHGDEIEGQQSGIGIYFPLDGNIGDMLVQAKSILQEAQEAFLRDRPDLRSEYKLATKQYVISSLHNKLTIFRAVTGFGRSKAYTNIFAGIQKELFLPRPLNQMSPDVINDFMADNFDGACRLLYYVKIGEFPNFDLPPHPYNPRRNSRSPES